MQRRKDLHYYRNCNCCQWHFSGQCFDPETNSSSVMHLQISNSPLIQRLKGRCCARQQKNQVYVFNIWILSKGSFLSFDHGRDAKLSYPLFKKLTGHPTFELKTVSTWNVLNMFETPWCYRFVDDKYLQFFPVSPVTLNLNLAVFTFRALFMRQYLF